MSEESTKSTSMDLTEFDPDEHDSDIMDNRGGYGTPIEDSSIDYELSENVVYDLVKYIRSNTVKNEEQAVLTALSYLSGYFTEMDHYISLVIIGTSSSGKSHLQKQIENLFPEDHLYQTTTGSDKSLIYDGEWDRAYVASLDELNKPSDTLIEFLKSVHGDDENFTYKLTPDSAEQREDEEIETIVRSAKPYAFLYAQYDADFEMWNRLLKVPVYESESKNRAVGALSHDHYYIQIGEDDTEYGYDFEEGTKALRSHIRSIPKNIERANIPGRVFLPNGDPSAFDRSGSKCKKDGGFGWDVYEVLKPIYSHGRSEVNRIYDMITNLVRASALLNYKNREIVYMDVPNHSAGRYIIAEPQDVANVLRTRETLLATTHELDDKKRSICEAIEQNTGETNEADMSTIIDGLEDSNMSMLNRTELRNNLEQLHENYLIDINMNGGENGQDTYIFNGWGELGHANVYEYEGLFEDTFDPISGENFLTTFEERKNKFQNTAKDLTSGTDKSVSSATNQQRTIGGGSTKSIELERHEETVREYMKDAIDGERIKNLENVPIEGLLGLTDPNDPENNVKIKDTPLDPTHGCWYQPDKPDDWVENEKDARRHISNAIRKLRKEGIVLYNEVHEVNKSGEAVDVTFAVLGEEDI